LIEPPPARRREYLARLHAEQQWADLVLHAEESFGQQPFHFWLDLQRFLFDALSALGREYAPAREATLHELQLLVRRLPGLSALTFADGTRFAAPAVVSWLDDQAAATAATVSSETRSERTGNASGDEQFANARQRLVDGDLNGAIALLERGAAQDMSDRQRFQRRVYMASLCVEAGQLTVARALLEELSQTIELHGLARWEPELAMTVWTRQYACYANLAVRLPHGPEADKLGREMESVFGRICRVDTSRALATAQEARRPP
jgi:type VI secretion system protein VasJ